MAWNEQSQVPAGIPHVSICVPHWSSVQLEWVERTYGPLRFIPQPDFAKSNRLARGLLNLDMERNFLAKAALEDKTVTHILFLDTDCICEMEPNQALRHLLATNVHVVSGLYRAKKSKGDYPYAMWMRNPKPAGEQWTFKDGYGAIGQWTGNFIQADVIGLGMCLIKREVFEKVPYPWFVWDSETSEDFRFCEKIREFGYKINVFTEIKLSHVGTMKVKTDGAIHLLDV